MPFALCPTPYSQPPTPISLLPTPYPLPPVSKGFTLIELIISISILGIIVLITGSAMKAGFRAVGAGEQKMEALERVRTSLKIIDRQIQSGVPLSYLSGGDLKYYFSGRRESLRLSTNYSFWSDKRGYVIVTYRVVTGSDGKKSMFASENIVGINEGREAKLLEGFDDIYFEYFFRDPANAETEGEWITDWEAAYNIPEKVRLRLVDGTKHLSMVIPVRVLSIEL
ncbi:MAG: prepilin-type N-terminal cleavage/methylation domain-containing protein [Nitrospiraceae bacterium]|nr:MAG: prepilin-type N-terminal cleavage/methylation domain-containing protein [Nitrospiraceae bacterium]